MVFQSTRRLRKNNRLRRLIEETSITAQDLIYPLFVTEGIDDRREMTNMPGVYCYNIEMALQQVEKAQELGIGGIVLRPMPKSDDYGVWDKVSEFQTKVIEEVASNCSDLALLVDGFFTAIDSNGFYGIKDETGEMDYYKTIELLKNQAIEHAESGADVVLSLGRIDNAVGSIRQILDINKYEDVPILAYSANFASSLAHAMLIDPEVSEVHRKGFLDSKIGIGNSKEGMRQIEIEINQGADIIGFKPSFISMDLMSQTKREFNMPTAAYLVSKEYSMIKAGAKQGYLDEKDTVMEISTVLKRSGADNIMTYWALEQAKWLERY